MMEKKISLQIGNGTHPGRSGMGNSSGGTMVHAFYVFPLVDCRSAFLCIPHRKDTIG